MSQNLPNGGFKWIKSDKWNSIFKRKEGLGYFIECGLEYSETLHDLHNDYHLAPEKRLFRMNGYLIAKI